MQTDFLDESMLQIKIVRVYNFLCQLLSLAFLCILCCSCQFVVRKNGDYAIHTVNPDTLVDWDLIEQVVRGIKFRNNLFVGCGAYARENGNSSVIRFHISFTFLRSKCQFVYSYGRVW